MYRFLQCHKKAFILDTSGVIISSEGVFKGMQTTFAKKNILITKEQIQRCTRSSKPEHISAIIKDKFPFHSSILSWHQDELLKDLIKDYPKTQLEVYEQDPTLSQLLDGVHELLKDKRFIITSMFPIEIFNFLLSRFKEQGLDIKQSYCYSKNEFQTRAKMIDSCMQSLPKDVNHVFFGDTQDDMRACANFKQLIVVGVTDHSAESKNSLPQLLVKAGAYYVIPSLNSII